VLPEILAELLGVAEKLWLPVEPAFQHRQDSVGLITQASAFFSLLSCQDQHICEKANPALPIGEVRHTEQWEPQFALSTNQPGGQRNTPIRANNVTTTQKGEAMAQVSEISESRICLLHLGVELQRIESPAQDKGNRPILSDPVESGDASQGHRAVDRVGLDESVIAFASVHSATGFISCIEDRQDLTFVIPSQSLDFVQAQCRPKRLSEPEQDGGRRVHSEQTVEAHARKDLKCLRLS